MAELKYLFTATFLDGTKYTQPTDDKSVDGRGSSFRDIEHRLRDVALFSLSDGQVTHSVDLKDGHFEINGCPIKVGDPGVLIPPGTHRTLIYFRRNFHTIKNCVETQLGPDGVTYRDMGDTREHRVEYFIGWQANIGGSNYKVTVSVS